MATMGRLRRPSTSVCRARDQRGQVLVEMALMGLILALLLASLIDLWYAYYTYIAVTDAAAEGAAYGAAFPDRATDEIRSRAVGASGSLITISFSQVHVVTDTQSITVTVSYPHVLTTPFMQTIAGGPTISITQRAVEPILN